MALPVFGRSQAIDDLAANASAEACPTVFRIDEQNSDRLRSITLSGRCLPLRPVPTSVLQRYSKRLNPGATEATIQVLGPDPGDMSIHGHFHTRYMDDDSFQYFEVGRAMESVHTAERARQVLFEIGKAGQLVRVSWGTGNHETVQRGIIRRVKCDELRPQDIDWEIEFEWLADGDYNPALVVTQPPPSEKGLWDQVKGVVDKVNSTLDEAEGAYQEYVTQNLAKLNTVLSEADDLVERAFDMAARPADLAKSLAVTAGNVKQTIVDTQIRAIEMAGRYVAVADAWKNVVGRNCAFMPWNATRNEPGDGVDVQTAAAIGAIEVDLAVRRTLAGVRRLTDQAIRYAQANGLAADAAGNPQQIRDLYFVREGDSLRRVSTRYYGTPDRWQDIADATGLLGDVGLVAGMVLTIPEVG